MLPFFSSMSLLSLTAHLLFFFPSPPFPNPVDAAQAEPVRKLALEVRTKGKPLSTEASIIPGESEEDGMLRREYVMVGDNRAIEFGRTVDGTYAQLPPKPLLACLLVCTFELI